MPESTNREIIAGYKQLVKKVGKSRYQIWKDIHAGTFPAPIELGPNSIGWYEDEVDAWLASRPRRTYGPVQIYGNARPKPT